MSGKKTAAPAAPTIVVKKAAKSKLAAEAAVPTEHEQAAPEPTAAATDKAGKVRRVSAAKPADGQAAETKANKSAARKATTSAAEDTPKPAKKKAEKATAKSKTKSKDEDLDDTDLSDIDDELEGEPEATETAESASAAPVEKVKPLRMKISKAKEKALMKEFGLDDTVLSEEEVALRRQRLKTLIKLGKTRGYLTHGEINDHLPDKLVEAETLEVVISLLIKLGLFETFFAKRCLIAVNRKIPHCFYNSLNNFTYAEEVNPTRRSVLNPADI